MRQNHLSDDRLIDICLDRASDRHDTAVAPTESEERHLRSCAPCEERWTRLARLLADVREVAAAQADAHFTPDRLARQRARVLQRIDHEARHGRVLAFPAALGHVPTFTSRPRMRWVAAAAAAGLFIGVAAEHVTHWMPGRRVQPAAVANTVDVRPDALQLATAPLSEEEFLGRIELAAEGAASAALRPLDDLTPRVWEVAAR
ncbi:MAG: hypothetical protein A3I61_00650 [Acidobacteria bacterium RIFCSPLOWO2_02_FULL_68_18]|nr:MAG: hypothetical protein A3I61_00650 [Acidobacteria bacterium RIFCSPLOWO2_02_FULL_68_18]OFW49414.1 MAG: hypothetical protein A3G77_02020 [Acidobacteria bacterium RIFCSPLOWO2_12_FULL_68_19]